MQLLTKRITAERLIVGFILSLPQLFCFCDFPCKNSQNEFFTYLYISEEVYA